MGSSRVGGSRKFGDTGVESLTFMNAYARFCSGVQDGFL